MPTNACCQVLPVSTFPQLKVETWVYRSELMPAAGPHLTSSTQLPRHNRGGNHLQMSVTNERCRLSWLTMLLRLLVLVAGVLGEPYQLSIGHTWDGGERLENPVKLTLDADPAGLLLTVEAK